MPDLIWMLDQLIDKKGRILVPGVSDDGINIIKLAVIISMKVVTL